MRHRELKREMSYALRSFCLVTIVCVAAPDLSRAMGLAAHELEGGENTATGDHERGGHDFLQKK